MKKVFYLALCVTMVALVACKNNNKTRNAGATAQRYAMDLQNRNYNNLVNSMHLDDYGDWDDVQRERTIYVNVLQNEIEPVIQRKGGIRQVNVVSEKATNDGNRATVQLENVYGNGSRETYPVDLVWVDNGWKLDMDKRRQVWHVKNAEGHDVTFKIKDYEDKMVFKRHEEGEDREFVKIKDGDRRDVVKVKEDGEKEVTKVIDKGDEIKIKHKEDGEKEVTTIKK